jgi:hypothetical protein
MANCSKCGGTGKVECPNCGGTKVERGSGNPCNKCDHAGWVSCPQCGGGGSSSSSDSSSSNSKMTGLKILGKILKVFWDFFADMFK